jgi:hypothetical protein
MDGAAGDIFAVEQCGMTSITLAMLPLHADSSEDCDIRQGKM